MAARLAYDADLAECLVCGLYAKRGDEQCRSCSTPIVLAHLAAHAGHQPLIVTALGDAGAGKTVYLGVMLDMLAQSARKAAVPRGRLSVELPEHVLTHLADRRFPPNTPPGPDRWQWAYYELSRAPRRRPTDVVFPDISGRALAEEISEARSRKIFPSLLNRSHGLLFCIDAAAATHGVAADLFGLRLATYLDAILGSKRKNRITQPIAIVLCKSDYCPEAFDDPAGFAESNLGRLSTAFKTYFERVEFFAASAVGSLGYATNLDEPSDVVPIPLHLAPRGILEPLDWLLELR
jgi:hypothetical protein